MRGVVAAHCVATLAVVQQHAANLACCAAQTSQALLCLDLPSLLQAQECRRKDDIESCARKGLAVVETDSARAKLVSWGQVPAAPWAVAARCTHACYQLEVEG